MWYCVTITNPACKEWDGATEKLVASFSSEADCVAYAKKIARKVHTSLHFDLEYVCRKGVPPEPYAPGRRPSFQTETLLPNEDGKLTNIKAISIKPKRYWPSAPLRLAPRISPTGLAVQPRPSVEPFSSPRARAFRSPKKANAAEREYYAYSKLNQWVNPLLD
jgi:hypothetical protein